MAQVDDRRSIVRGRCQAVALAGVLALALTGCTELCTYTVTNNTDRKKSDLHVEIAGAGPLTTPAAITDNAPGCPAATPRPSGTQVDIDWGTDCVENGEAVTFNVTAPGRCEAIVKAVWTPEPTDEDALEVFVSYVWDYPGFRDLSDLSREKVESVARGFFDRLKDGEEWNGPGTAIKVNAEAVFRHWDTTGENENLDRADFGLFVGHGRPFEGALYQWSFYDGDLNPTDANDGNEDPKKRVGLWGDMDLEWVTAIACNSTLDDWIKTFGGLHLVLGYNDAPFDFDLDKDLGRQYAVNLGSMTVVQAWYAANEKKAKRIKPGAIAIDKANFRDFIWGKGSGPRPDPAKYRNAEPQEGFRLDLREAPAAPPPSFGSSSSSNGDAPSSPPPAPPGSMRRYAVVPRTVDDAYRQGIARGLCRAIGRFCAAGAPAQAGGEWLLTDGAGLLLVDSSSGGFSYIDTAAWMFPTDEPARLPPTLPEAVAAAGRFLATMGFAGPDAVRDAGLDAEAVIDTLETDQDGTVRVTATERLHAIVGYSRVLRGDPDYPVEGAAGVMRVHVGAGGEIIAFFRNDWRDVAPLGETPIISPDLAAERLSAYFPPEEVLGPPCVCESLSVQGSTLGYLQVGAGTAVSSFEPYYFLDALCQNGDEAFAVRYAVPAVKP